MWLLTQKQKTGLWDLSSFGILQTFARYDYAYIIYDMHISSIRIHMCSVVDINKENNSKYDY